MKPYHLMYPLVVLISLMSSRLSAQQTETRTLPPFTQVRVGGSFDVVLTAGTEESVKIESSRLDLDEILTEVDGKVLKIGLKKGNYGNTGTIRMRVSYRNLEALSNSGSSVVSCTSEISANHFELRNSGSGKVKLASLQANSLEVSNSGSGNLEIAGQSREQTINVSGSGKINASDLRNEVSKVSISGSGDVDLFVNEVLEARISGSGQVQYRGNPDVRNVRVSGSGSIRKVR
jgi:hypothetical protein